MGFFLMLSHRLVLQRVEEVSIKSVLVEIQEDTLLDYPKNLLGKPQHLFCSYYNF